MKVDSKTVKHVVAHLSVADLEELVCARVSGHVMRSVEDVRERSKVSFHSDGATLEMKYDVVTEAREPDTSRMSPSVAVKSPLTSDSTQHALFCLISDWYLKRTGTRPVGDSVHNLVRLIVEEVNK